jgi:hypothetical protein
MTSSLNVEKSNGVDSEQRLRPSGSCFITLYTLSIYNYQWDYKTKVTPTALCRQYTIYSRQASASWGAILQPGRIPEPVVCEQVRKDGSSGIPCAFHLLGKDVARRSPA